MRYNVVMLNETQTPQIETDLTIYRDGSLDTDYKRRKAIKRIKVVAKATGALTADYGTWLIINPIKNVGREISHQVKLEVIDMIYKTNLHNQYKAGKRSQMILRTKRQLGLM